MMNNPSEKQISKKPSLPKKIALASTLAVILIACISYWLHSARYISTDDGYVNAHVVRMASLVTGQVAHLYVQNNQYVRQGQILFSLDTDTFQAAVDKANAQVAINEAEKWNAQLTADRVANLVKRKAASPQEQDSANAKLAALAASVRSSQADLKQAQLDLVHTRIYAPTSGWVTEITLRVGNIIEANQPLFMLISDSEYWVDANFKETQLEKIKPGMVADIKLDMYPDKTFKGYVQSISNSSGVAFSLLPPQNATGNWVKVTQRVPVRVKIIHSNPDYPLRIGSTATVTIHLRDKRK